MLSLSQVGKKTPTEARESVTQSLSLVHGSLSSISINNLGYDLFGTVSGKIEDNGIFVTFRFFNSI